jgi:hypothetical protein
MDPYDVAGDHCMNCARFNNQVLYCIWAFIFGVIMACATSSVLGAGAGILAFICASMSAYYYMRNLNTMCNTMAKAEKTQ